MSAFSIETELKARVTTRLTFPAVQKLERQKYWALILLLFLLTISLLWLLFQFASSQDGPALFSNGMYTLTSLLGACWSLRAAYLAARGPVVLSKRHRWSWIFIGLGLVANGLGNVYYGIDQYLLGSEPPLPSYADIGFTLFYLLCLIGLLLLPVRGKNLRLGFHIVIDSLITVLCLLGISWYIVINPVLAQAGPDAPLFQTIVGVSYPCWDILLVLALMLFVQQRAAPVLRPSLWLYSLGVFAQVWADSGYVYLTSYNQYQSGMVVIDFFWFLGFLLMGIAPLYQYNAIARQAYTKQAVLQDVDNHTFKSYFVFLQSTVIYFPFLVLLLLTLFSQFTPNKNITYFLDILCTIVLSLLITHYVLTTYQNARLIHEKEQSSAMAELLRKATASLSSVLEMDLLLNHIVIIGAAELGFDAVALMLPEEYERPLAEQNSLLSRATTSRAINVMSWRIYGEKVPFCLPFLGKELELRWQDAPAHQSTQIHQWHKEQGIRASFFVPLVYQGKMRGSVLFSLRAARPFSEREVYLARAFAEEAANAIEHARLYELARENALFAQAMSNVAARLNAAVATSMGPGAEIHHLICTEGANALRADLALLYVYQAGRFVPLGAVACDSQRVTFAQEWPQLSVQTYAALLHSSQPVLLHISQAEVRQQQQSLFAGKTISGRLSSISATMPAVRLQSTGVHRLRPSSARLPAVRTALVVRQPLITLEEALRRRALSTAIVAPLLIHQQPVGLLVLARGHKPDVPGKRPFAPPDLELAQDFTEQAAIALTNARLYQQIRTAHRRLQELDKLKDQFMVTASHELRTPLTAVQGYLELLENYHTTLPEDQLREFLAKASRGCDELILLLNNVMDASRLEVEAGIRTAQLEPVSVREAVESIVDLILLQASQEQREIRVNIPAHLLVKAEPTRLRQVLRNLSVNALKYSPPGTPLNFSAHPAFTQNADVVILTVTDYGKGIKPADQARLFQRFVRLEDDLNSVVRGSGLGLYISRRLVEAMNGRIWIESTGIPGAGTTFAIQLPMV